MAQAQEASTKWLAVLIDALRPHDVRREFFCQYDAWNRVVQVNRAGNLTWWRFNKWGIRQRELVLAISEDNAAFQAVFATIQFQARSLGVAVSVQVLP